MNRSIAILVISASVLTGCDTAEKRLAEAEAAGTIASYRNVISKYPESKEAQTANARISGIESWNEIRDQRDKATYEEYLQKHPDGLFVSDAESRILEIDSFNSAALIDTVPAYRQFAEEFPDGVFVDDVGQRMSDLAQADTDYELVMAGEEIEKFRAYIKTYEDTGYANLAVARLEELVPEPVALVGAIVECYLNSSRGDAIRRETIPARDENPRREILNGTFTRFICNEEEIDVVSASIDENIIQTSNFGDIEIRQEGLYSFSFWATRDQAEQLRRYTTTTPVIQNATVTSIGDAGRIVTARLDAGGRFEMEFQRVEGGCYEMGDTFGAGNNNELPVHTACVGSFYLGKYEVTRSQWESIVGSVPSVRRCGTETCPVSSVTWYDSQYYADMLTELVGTEFRLPTEAEWEYACRSGGKREEYSGGGEDANAVAWHRGNSSGLAHEVGLKSPNGLQLFDMSGNVAEFVEDAYSENAYAEHTRANPLFRAVRERHTLRGGNYYFDGGAPTVRCAVRHSIELPAHFTNYGFRLVMVE